MSEPTPKEMEEKLAEYERNLKASLAKKGINAEIDNSGVKELLEQWRKDREKLEEETTLREDYESKLVLVAERELQRKKQELGAPEWIKDPETLKQWADEQEEESGGNLSLSDKQKAKEGNLSHKKGYSSIPDMIDDLVLEGDTETLNKLKNKWQSDIEQHASMQSNGKTTVVFTDPVKETGETFTERFKRIQNEKLRRKMMEGRAQ